MYVHMYMCISEKYENVYIVKVSAVLSNVSVCRE